MKNKKGFTLIEILLVIVIIGILAIMLIPNLLGGPSKARDTQRSSTASVIATYLTNKAIAGKVVGGCIYPTMTHDVGTLGEIINPENFGGSIPTDPKNDESTYLVGGCPKPGYLVIKGDKSNSDDKYTLGVFARVENKNQGNFDCNKLNGLDGTVAQVMTSDEWVLTPGNGNCFANLIQ